METLEAKRAQAIEYLRSRGKYVLDEGCTFKPTPYTEPVDIVKKYADAAGMVGQGTARPGQAR